MPWARGHDLGLHVVARALRTWGEDALVALTAYPPGARGSIGKSGAKALSRYWSRLGLKQAEGSDPPILTGDGNSRQLDNTTRKLSAWHPPTRRALSRTGHAHDPGGAGLAGAMDLVVSPNVYTSARVRS